MPKEIFDRIHRMCEGSDALAIIAFQKGSISEDELVIYSLLK